MKKQLFAILLILLFALSGCRATDVSIEKESVTSTDVFNAEFDVIPDTETTISEITYIANKSTKKVHYPWCHSVKQMKEKNKMHLNCPREEVLIQGYTSCQKCNP